MSLFAIRRPALRLTRFSSNLCEIVTYGEYYVMVLRDMVLMEPSVWLLPPETGISPEYLSKSKPSVTEALRHGVKFW